MISPNKPEGIFQGGKDSVAPAPGFFYFLLCVHMWLGFLA